MLLFFSSAQAQWWVNSATLPALQTSGILGTATYNNVVVNGHLAVNVTSSVCPYPTGSTSLTQDMPLVVNGALVLWDTTGDNMRSIMGLSPAGGVAIYTGNDAQTGSALILNAMTNPTNGGSINALSYGATSSSLAPPLGLAYQNFDGTTTNNIFLISKAGLGIFGPGTDLTNMKANDVFTVEQQIGLYNPDPTGWVQLHGNTDKGALRIAAMTEFDDGPSFEMTGTHSGGHGLINYISASPMNTTIPIDFMHVFRNYEPGSFITDHLGITTYGNTIIGEDIYPWYGGTNDILTVQQQLGFYSDKDFDPRNIEGHTDAGLLQISTKSNTDDGPSLIMYGKNHATAKGQIQYYSKYYPPTSGLPTFGHTFFNSDGGSGFNPIMGIANSGNVTIGLGAATTWARSGDMLTVQDQIGLFDADPTAWVHIHGYRYLGVLQIAANTGYMDGPSFEMTGIEGAGHGQINYLSASPTFPTIPLDFIHSFKNYDPLHGTFFCHLGITTNGNTIIGKDIYPTDGGSGDVLAVQDQIGLYDADPTAWVHIHGNTNQGVLQIAANTSYEDGPSFEMTGKSSGGHGQVNYISSSRTNTAIPLDFIHSFKNYDPSTSYTSTGFTCHMGITTYGNTIIGKDIWPWYGGTNDVLTVQKQLGFYSDNDIDTRSIAGHTNAGFLQLSANNDYTDGGSIQLYGASGSTAQGEVHFHSTTPDPDYYNRFGHTFYINNFWGQVPVMGVSNQLNVTIGANASPAWRHPGDVLTVEQQIGFYSNDPYSQRVINGNATKGVMALNAGSAIASEGGTGGRIELYPTTTTWGSGASSIDDRRGALRYISNGDPASANYAHLFINYDGAGDWAQSLGITYNGMVTIGTVITPAECRTGYRLFVQDGILTEHVRVAVRGTTSWADNVFEKNYKLMPINKLGNYLNSHKHLPDIPSAKEVVKDGIDLGSMDAMLLKKVEELTLYMIQMQKQIDDLKTQLATTTKK